jgi:hypothetical protein
LQVLKGSAQLLSGGRICHILFEDHDVDRSEVVAILVESGFEIFSIGWSMRGLTIEPVKKGNLAAAYEAPSFGATLDPRTILSRLLRPRGWRVLSDTLARRHRLS